MQVSTWEGGGFIYYLIRQRHKLRKLTGFCAHCVAGGGDGRSITPTFLTLALDGNAWLSFVPQLLDTEGKSSQYPLCRRLVGHQYWSGCY